MNNNNGLCGLNSPVCRRHGTEKWETTRVKRRPGPGICLSLMTFQETNKKKRPTTTTTKHHKIGIGNLLQENNKSMTTQKIKTCFFDCDNVSVCSIMTVITIM